MVLSPRIKTAIQTHPEILAALKLRGKDQQWTKFTRTHFNIVARIINRRVTREVTENEALVEMNLVIGKLQMEKQLHTFHQNGSSDFVKWLSHLNEYRVFNWVSGKTLQSYWNGGAAKYVKINALLVFLRVPFTEWEAWQRVDAKKESKEETSYRGFPFSANAVSKSSLTVIKKYYLGNYFLYYQKTDGSRHIIKTPFVIKENEGGQIIVRSVSEGHRYRGQVLGIRDGCLYINCQNLDFDEMEQYIFNIGLETKPQVLFGVSNTVSVKNMQAVALKNILVKQEQDDPDFEMIRETEIPFSKKYSGRSEEALIVNHLKNSSANVITTLPCCHLKDLASVSSVRKKRK